MAKKIVVDVRVNKSGKGASQATQEIAQLTEQIKKLTELQEKNAGSSDKISDSIDKLTKKIGNLNNARKKSTEGLTVEEKAIKKNEKANENLAITQVKISKNTAEVRAETSDLNKTYAEKQKQELKNIALEKKISQGLSQESIESRSLELQLRLLNKTRDKAAEALLKQRAETDKTILVSQKEQDQMKTTAGLSGALITELGRVASDAQYGLRGMGNNISQVMTLFALFQTNVAKSGRTMGEGFRELGKTMLGPVGIVAGLQLLLTLIQDKGFQNFIEDLRTNIKGLRDIQEAFKKASEEAAKSIYNFTRYTNVLKDASATAEQKAISMKKLNKEYPDYNTEIYNEGLALSEVNKANDEYIEGLKDRAKARAIDNKLTEITSKRLELDFAVDIKLFEKREEFENDIQFKRLENLRKTKEQIAEANKLGFSTQEGRNFIESARAENKLFQKFFTKEGEALLEGQINQATQRVGELKKVFAEEVRNAEKEAADDLGIDLKDLSAREATIRKFLGDLYDDLDTTTTNSKLKRVSTYKNMLISFAREQLKSDQDLLATRNRTEQQMLTEQGEASKESVKIKRDEFIKKEELRLVDFIKTQELRKKEKGANVTAIQEQIDLAKLKSSETIRLAFEEADGVIQTIDKVTEARKRNALAIQELNQRRRDDEVQESDAGTTVSLMSVSMDKINAEAALDQLRYDNKVARAKELLALETTTEEQRRDIKRDMLLWEDEKRKTDLQNEMDVINEKQRVQQEYINFVSGLTGILQAIGNKNKALQKAQLVLEKGAAIANVIVNTNKAIAARTAISTSLAGVDAPAAAKDIAKTKITAGISIANIIAAGISENQSINSSGGGASSGATTVQPPDFNIIGSSNVNQLADAIGSTEKQPIKAYVVSTEVTTEQALNRNTRSSAEL